MACALVFIGNDDTSETRRFIRLADMFFDCLNVQDTLSAIKRNSGVHIKAHLTFDSRFVPSLLIYMHQ